MESFKIIWPALPVFWPKAPKKITFFTWKYICSKILVIFHLFKKESPVFVWNWTQNKCSLLNIFLLNFHSLTYRALLWDSTVLYQSPGARAYDEYLYDHLLQLNLGLVLHIDRDLPTHWSEKGFTFCHSKSYIWSLYRCEDFEINLLCWLLAVQT